MGEKSRLRALVVAGAVDAAMGLSFVHVPTLARALALLGQGEAFAVVLIGPETLGATPLEAIGALHAQAPTTPVVVIPRHTTQYLGVALEMATRNPHTAAATARRVWDLLPTFLERRAQDVVTLQSALERGDFEAIARIGHSLRGNGVSFAFPEISAIGEAVEAGALAGNGDDIQRGIARLRGCLGQLEDSHPADEVLRRR
jgi:HPt (histidine-containing phosphotransfer) domain-containing protein